MKISIKSIFPDDGVRLNPFHLDSKPLFAILQIFILYTFLASSAVWIDHIIPLTPYYYMAFIMEFFLFLSIGQHRLTINKRTGTILALCIAIGICSYITNANVLISVAIILSYIPAVLFTLLTYRNQRYLLLWTTKVFSIIMAISIIVYIILFFVHLPSIGTFAAKNEYYPPYNNYIFFLQSTFIGDVFRFNGPFLEPGHLGMACTFLLYANKYNFKAKPYLWILLIADIISFSLSGWMLTIIGICILKIRSSKSLVGSVIVIGGLYLFAINYNNGDNYINNLVVERMQYDEEKGIKGNNRVGIDTDRYYENLCSSGKIITGVGTEKARKEARGAGYKMYFIHNGIISAVFAFLLYWFLLPPGRKSRFELGFLTLIIICFLSRAYPTWYTWLLPYVLGTWVEYGERINKTVLLNRQSLT